MGNLNINRTGSDPNDNVIRRYDEKQINYREFGLSVAMVVGVFSLITLVFYGVMKLECYWTCGTFQYVFYGWIGIQLIILGAGLYIWQRNSAYLSFRGIRVHIKDLRAYADKVLNIGQTSAESEATAGMDNYSPSINTSSTSIPNIGLPSDTDGDDDIDVNTLPFDRLMK